MQVELDGAATAHQAALTALQTYTATSPIDTLQRQIGEKVLLRDSLQLGRDTILDTIAVQDRTARTNLFTELTNAQSQGMLAVVTEQSLARSSEINRLFTDRNAAKQQLAQARALQEQIQAGGDAAAASNRMALQILKNLVFAGTSPESLIFTGEIEAPPSAAEQEADVQALIAALEQHIVQLDAAIADASQSMIAGEGFQFLDQLAVRGPSSSATDSPTAQTELEAAIARSYGDLFTIGEMAQLNQLAGAAQADDPLARMMEELDRSIQTLRAELVAEEAQLQLLIQQHDLAWDTYSALSSKAAELGIERPLPTARCMVARDPAVRARRRPQSEADTGHRRHARLDARRLRRLPRPLSGTRSLLAQAARPDSLKEPSMPIHFGTDGWRAVISDEFTFDNVRKVAQAIAEEVNAGRRSDNETRPKMVVGFDTRFLSDRYAIAVAEVLAANGIEADVTQADAPTPMVSCHCRPPRRRRRHDHGQPQPAALQRTEAQGRVWRFRPACHGQSRGSEARRATGAAAAR